MLDTWVLTVASLRNSRSAISAFDRPAASSASTSRSRSVSSASAGAAPLRCAGQRAGEAVEQPPRDGRREQRLAARDDPDRVDELRRLDVLEQEAARARAQRLEDVLVEVERGEDQDRAPRIAGRHEPPGRLDAVHARHPDVHQDHVGQLRGRRARRAWTPSSASPTTSMSSRASSTIRKPLRTSAWSSHSSTRMLTGALRPAGSMREPRSRRSARGPACSSPPSRLHALAHADHATARGAVAIARRGRCRRRSTQSSSASSAVCRIVDLGGRDASACLSALVSASCTMRYARQVDARRQRSGSGPSTVEPTSQPGGAAPARPAPAAGRARLRRAQLAAGVAVRRTDDAEQPPQLGQRLAAGRLDRRRAPRARARDASRTRPAGSRLHHHHAHVVRDHVVQLARDPRPLQLGRVRGGLVRRAQLRLARSGTATGAPTRRRSRPRPRRRRAGPRTLSRRPG